MLMAAIHKIWLLLNMKIDELALSALFFRYSYCLIKSYNRHEKDTANRR